jgi:hypothetical protein
MSAFVSQLAPDFKAEAYVNGGFKELSLSQFKGKKVVLFSIHWTSRLSAPLRFWHSLTRWRSSGNGIRK